MSDKKITAALANAGVTHVELTQQQLQQWNDTQNLMGWTAPGFLHIARKLLVHNNSLAVFTKDVPTAATDAKCIMANPDFFFGLGLRERVFVYAHEIVHNIYDDCTLLHRCRASGKVPMANGKSVEFDEETMQKAMDYRINALLVDSRIGKMPEGAIKLPGGKGEVHGLYDPKIASANDSVLDVYGKLYKKRKEGDEEGDGKGGQGSGKGKGKQGFDQVQAPGASQGLNPHDAAQQRNAQQWATELAIAKTIEEMRNQGQLPGSLQRMFEEILTPQIPWTEHIRGIARRKLGSGGYDWQRADRRMINRDMYAPGRSGHGVDWVAVWADTSGSISPPEMEMYLAEISGVIEELKPKRLTIYWCDAAVHQVDELSDASDLETVRHAGVQGGGGGTNCIPVFERIANEIGSNPPDALIGFTDAAATFPSAAPEYPVIWAVTTQTTPPFGDTVRIDTNAYKD
jgi:predicted metal-dependent peptidase